MVPVAIQHPVTGRLRRTLVEAGRHCQGGKFAHRLRDTATEYEAWKYVALADSVLARSAVARGNLPEGVTLMEAALAQLGSHPCPIVTWQIESTLGVAQGNLGDHEQATAAFDRAAAIIREVAGQVEDEDLRETFLSSTAVRDVLDPPGRVPGTDSE